VPLVDGFLRRCKTLANMMVIKLINNLEKIFVCLLGNNEKISNNTRRGTSTNTKESNSGQENWTMLENWRM